MYTEIFKLDITCTALFQIHLSLYTPVHIPVTNVKLSFVNYISATLQDAVFKFFSIILSLSFPQ